MALKDDIPWRNWTEEKKKQFIRETKGKYEVVCRGLNDPLSLDEQVAAMFALEAHLTGKD